MIPSLAAGASASPGKRYYRTRAIAHRQHPQISASQGCGCGCSACESKKKAALRSGLAPASIPMGKEICSNCGTFYFGEYLPYTGTASFF